MNGNVKQRVVNMQKIKNISGNKIEVAGHRLPAGHILKIEDTVDLSPYIKEGLIKDIKEKPPTAQEVSPRQPIPASRCIAFCISSVVK